MDSGGRGRRGGKEARIAMLARITRSTTNQGAVESFAAARDLFIRHRIDVRGRAVGMDDLNTRAHAEDWCDMADGSGLIVELNDAIASGRAEASAIVPAGAPVPSEAP